MRRPGADGHCASPVTLPRTPPGPFGCATANDVDRPQVALGSRLRPGTAPGPAGDRPSPPSRPAGDPTPITQVKVCTQAKSITGLSLSKPVPGFKSGYWFSGCRLTSLDENGELMELVEEVPLKELTDAKVERLVRG